MSQEIKHDATLYGYCPRHPAVAVRISDPVRAKSQSGAVVLCVVKSSCRTCCAASGRQLDLAWFKPKPEGWVPMFSATD